LTSESFVGKQRNRRLGGVAIDFSKIAPRLFSGFETKDGYDLAGRKKALLGATRPRKPVLVAADLEMASRKRENLLTPAGEFSAFVPVR